MRDFDGAMAHVKGFRRKFESLLQTARAKTQTGGTPPNAGGRLQELTAFGSNPGALRMFVYIPKGAARDAPLVVALHGCSQNAEEFDRGTGWSGLADQAGCVVVYPQQQPTNNAQNCFSWFLAGDTARGKGEALSIAQMIEHAVATLDLDRRRIFVTGLSAGGAMTAVMLATYPELFAGGAIIAGLPYGCAHSAQRAFEAMFTEQHHSARALGDRIRAASRHRGPWPKISVWHGTADSIVKPSNSEEVIRQWTDIHDLSAIPSYEEKIGEHTRRVWTDANGEALIEAFSVSGMAHGVPLATADEAHYGAIGPFFLEAEISSTARIANFWGLSSASDGITRKAPQKQRHRALVSNQNLIDGRDTATPLSADNRETAEHVADGRVKHETHNSAFDPQRVIADAFRAAGLPTIDDPDESGGSIPRTSPGSIIKAALKAAGLTGK